MNKPDLSSIAGHDPEGVSLHPIMVVDDNVDAAESLAEFVEFEGYKVTWRMTAQKL